jgi:thioredoxin-like negative regulator of GroEL
LGIRECDDAALKAMIEDASSPLVIDVHAPWCKFCKLMDPDITRLAEERDGSIRFAKIDNDDYPMVGVDLAVKTLPLVVLMVDGKEVARRGSGNYDELTAWLSEHGL